MEPGLLYCIVPRELGVAVRMAAESHWAGDPAVVVVAERRERDRRSGGEGGGRRVAERRCAMFVKAPSRLSGELRKHAARMTFARRRAGAGRDLEAIESDRIVARGQKGDPEAFEELYTLHLGRVYAYARVVLQDDDEAEDVARQVFVQAIRALPRYPLREGVPFRAWLFRITRDIVLHAWEHSGPRPRQRSGALERRLDSELPDGRFTIEWLTDKDLAVLVGRLAYVQQEAILARYLFDLRTADIAQVLGRSPVVMRMLEHRAIRALEARVDALRGRSRGSEHSAFAARPRPAPVLFHRRFALAACGTAPA